MPAILLQVQFERKKQQEIWTEEWLLNHKKFELDVSWRILCMMTWWNLMLNRIRYKKSIKHRKWSSLQHCVCDSVTNHYLPQWTPPWASGPWPRRPVVWGRDRQRQTTWRGPGCWGSWYRLFPTPPTSPPDPWWPSGWFSASSRQTKNQSTWIQWQRKSNQASVLIETNRKYDCNWKLLKNTWITILRTKLYESPKIKS